MKQGKVTQSNYMTLNNKMPSPSYPVSVDYSFLTALLNLEKAYHNEEPKNFRKNSHPIRKNHVTETSLRLLMTLSRRFNTEGTLSGVSIHALYSLMKEEYESSCSKEQFYAEIAKFRACGLLSMTHDGVVTMMKIEPFKRNTERFILVHPFVFSAAFTKLELAAQKLLIYVLSRTGSSKQRDFKESLNENCWIYTLTHKTRPSQIKKLLNILSKAAPLKDTPLIESFSVAKDATGRWMMSCKLDAAYTVRHQQGNHYKLVPKAKIPYSKTVSKLRLLLSMFKIREFENIENGLSFLRLVKLLKNASMKTLRFAVQRIYELLKHPGNWSKDLVSAIEFELRDQSFITFNKIVNETGVNRYFGIGNDPLTDDSRPYQIYRFLSARLSLKSLKKICLMAIPALESRFGKELNVVSILNNGIAEDFYIEDYLLSLA